MIAYFVRTLGAHYRSGRLLYALTVLGVALGVASVLSIQIINRNALAAFSGSMQAISGDADLTVVGTTPTIPETHYTRLLSTPGVDAAWPILRVHAALESPEPLYLEIVGVDFYSAVRFPEGTEDIDPSLAVSQTGWMAVTPTLATRMGWVVGDSIGVSRGTRQHTIVIGALIDFQRISPLASSKLAVMDIAQVQSLFGTPGQINQIDVIADEGTEVAALAATIQQRLGPAVQVVTPEQRQNEAAGLLQAFRLNLTALSLISLVVGLFIVYSSIQTALVRRRSEFGVLRSLGATRLQTFGLMLGEVSLLGSLGVLLGLPIGYVAARANLDTVSSTLSNLYLLQEIERLELPWWLFGMAAAIGIGGALLAALAPAWDLSRRHPKDLLSAYTLHQRASSMSSRLFVAAIALFAVTGVWYYALGAQWKPSGFLLAVVLMVGLSLLTPFAVQRLAGGIRVTSFGLGYSLHSLATRLQTTSVAIAALAVAVSMVVATTLMIGSFRATLDLWMEASVRADVYVTTESWRAPGSAATLDDEIVTQLAQYSGVRAVDKLRGFLGYYGDRRIGIAGIDFGMPGGRARFQLLEGDPNLALAQAGREAVLVSEPLARKENLHVGDTVRLAGPRGPVELPVGAVYYDYSSERGAVVMDLEMLSRHFGPGEVNNVALYLDPEIDPDEAVDQLRAKFAGLPLVIRSNRTLRNQARKVFDQTFAVTRLLQGMSLLIAATGVALSLLVLARERVAELALYRSLGATQTQVFRHFLGKGFGMSLFGLVLGGVGGIGLAGLLIYVINRTYFGWTIQVHVPWPSVAAQVVTIIAAAVAASMYPALRASRTPASELQREDL